MKKLIALLLTVVTVMSIMLPVVATETNDTVAPEAPVVRSVQLQEVKDGNDQITAYNIRFLSTVSSLSGSKLGYEVSAQFEGTNGITRQVYSAANGDTNMEGSTVYSKIYVYDGGEKTSVDAAQLAALKLREGEDASTAKGIFAVAITGVPTNVDVIFTVKSYVIHNGEKIESTVVATKYADGDCVNITEDVKYQENFNDAKGLNASLSECKHSALAVSYVSTTYAIRTTMDNFSKNVSASIPGWKLTGVAGSDTQTVKVENGAVVLNGYSTIQAVAPGSMAAYDVYSIDMDLKLTDSSTLEIFFNNVADGGHYNGAGNLLSLSQSDSNVAVGLSAYVGSNSRNQAYRSSAETVVTNAKYGEPFHLTMLVDNHNAVLTILINGTKVNFNSNAIVFKRGGGLEFRFNNSDVAIDNIVMIGQEKDVLSKKDQQVLYTQGFSNADAKNDFAGVFNASSRFEKHVKVETREEGDGILSMAGSEFYVFELVAKDDSGTTLRNKLKDQDKYYVKMNITTDTNTNGWFKLVFNTDGTSEFAKNAYPSSAINYSVSTGNFGTCSILDLRDQQLSVINTIAGTDTEKQSGMDIKNYTNGSNTFDLVMVVDNTGADTKVTIYINDVEVVTVEGLYNNDGGIYIWTQNTTNPVELSYLEVGTGAYTPAA